jgi:hypothetical protein
MMRLRLRITDIYRQICAMPHSIGALFCGVLTYCSHCSQSWIFEELSLCVDYYPVVVAGKVRRMRMSEMFWQCTCWKFRLPDSSPSQKLTPNKRNGQNFGQGRWGQISANLSVKLGFDKYFYINSICLYGTVAWWSFNATTNQLCGCQ